MKLRQILIINVLILSFACLGASAHPGLLPEKSEDGSHLVSISKDVLGAEFLLHYSVASVVNVSTLAPTCESMAQDLIVSFERNGKFISLLESLEGHTMKSGFDASMLLANFPIIHETNDSMTVDFNAGMTRFFEPRGELDGKATVTPFKESYLKDVSLKGGKLQIRQGVQIAEEARSVEFGEVQYYFSRYQENPEFRPKRFFKDLAVKAFLATPYRKDESGDQYAHFLKWDIKKPVQFVISSNTPEAYRDAIRDGVEYWNGAFGTKILEVSNAPEGIRAPDPQYNMIQWVESESASTAYADMSSDPRTGEIRHAQMFLPSGYVKHFEHLFRAEQRANYRPNTFFFEPNFNSIATPEALHRVVSDGIRKTIAHELGHILGLRHQFLASVDTNLSLTQKDALFSDYAFGGTLRAKQIPGLSSSVMDYLDNKEAVLMGAQIKAALENNTTGFEYDRRAITSLYFEDEAFWPRRFCTDEGTSVYADCAHFDFGKNSIAYHSFEMKKKLQMLPSKIVEDYISMTKKGIPLHLVGLDPSPVLSNALEHARSLIAWFSKETRSRYVESLFPHRGPTLEDEVKKAELSRVTHQVRAVGGLEKALFFLLPPIRDSKEAVAEWTRTLDEFLANNYQGFTFGGEPYHFNEDEIQLIRAQGIKMLHAMERKLIDEALDLIANVVVDTEELGGDFESLLSEVASHIILAATGNFFAEAQKSQFRQLAVAFPEFAYSQDTRKRAAKLLFAKALPGFDWSASARQTISDRMHEMGSVDIAPFQGSENFRAIRKWINEQSEILKVVETGQI